MKKYLTLMYIAGTIMCASLTVAQLPATGIHMIQYSNVDAKFNIKKVSYLTDFNSGGYNNQPFFSGLDELLITSDYYRSGKPDIIKLDLYSNKLERMTNSVESDFSPMPLPNANGFSTVRIEQDNVTQTLWAYDNESFATGYRLLPEVSTIGYYHWLSEVDIAMFLLPEPFTLNTADVSTEEKKAILDNIGRCFKQDDQGRLLFTHLVNGSTRYIKRLDPETGKIDVLCTALEGSEDFELIAGGAVIMGRGTEIFYFEPSTSSSWTSVMDLGEYGIKGITRLAYSRGKIVLVGE